MSRRSGHGAARSTRHFAALMWGAVAALLSVGSLSARAQMVSPPAGTGSSVVLAGRALFHGEAGWRQPPLVAGVPMPPDASACARCHGRNGEGSVEGGVSVPALTAGTPELARRLVRHAEQGVGDDGRPLLAPMPAYRLDPAEREALTAFLAVMGTDSEPVRGVSTDRVVLGTLLPDSGPRAAIGQAILAGMRSHFDELSRQGGLYGRRVELVVLPWNGDVPLSGLPPWLKARQAQTPMLALVGSFVGDLDAAVVRELAELRLPMLANLGPALRERESAALAGWVSTLMPSVQTQVRLAQTDFNEHCPAALDGASGAEAEPIEIAVAPVPGLDQAVQRGLQGQATRAMRPSTASPVASPMASPVASTMASKPSRRRVLSLLPAAETQALRQGLGQGDCLWSLAMFSGVGGPDLPKGLAGELLTFPSQVNLPQPGGQPHSLWQGLGRLAAQLSTEALARAGHRLQPEAVAQAQTSLKSFEPVAGVSMELSRTRRHALPVTTQWRTP